MTTSFFQRGLSNPWDDVLVTHQDAVNRLPASIREDFQPPGPFDALKACGISFADLTMPKVAAVSDSVPWDQPDSDPLADLDRALKMWADAPYQPHVPLLSPQCGLPGHIRHDACRSLICECRCHARLP